MKPRFTRPELKYSSDSLSPMISGEIIDLHYGKHLQGYLNNLNNLLPGSIYENSSLEEIICDSSVDSLYNNAAQVWNHIFYFDTFSPSARCTPIGSLANAIDQFFGSFEEFKAEFERQGAAIFGSGWVWLARTANDELRIVSEGNAGNPLRSGLVPLLTFDVWEHAYYLDYQNRRAEHLSKLWNIVDWEVIEGRYVNLI